MLGAWIVALILALKLVGQAKAYPRWAWRKAHHSKLAWLAIGVGSLIIPLSGFVTYPLWSSKVRPHVLYELRVKYVRLEDQL
jgi:hypothetical protein